MVLEDLHALIETLRDRITKHGPALRQSEALTRYTLIDPLLRELGWDTSDPAHVGVEVRFGSGSADYALLGAEGKPRVIVEAKKLGTPLKNAVSQGINYSIEDGILYFALTDGQHWELYETHRPVPLSQKLVMKLNLGGSVAETCLNALVLWRPSAADGHVQAGATPVVPTDPTESPTPVEPPQTGSFSDETDGGGWHALSEFSPQSGSKPQAVRYPSGDVQTTTDNWSDPIVAVVRWLYEKGHLKESHLPIQRTSKTYIVAATPTNPTGTKFSAKRQVGPFFLNVHGTAEAQIRNIRFVRQARWPQPSRLRRPPR